MWNLALKRVNRDFNMALDVNGHQVFLTSEDYAKGPGNALVPSQAPL
jgi:hypothetical protein